MKERRLLPAASGSFLLPRPIGLTTATELISTGWIIDAADSHRLLNVPAEAGSPGRHRLGKDWEQLNITEMMDRDRRPSLVWASRSRAPQSATPDLATGVEHWRR